MSGPRVRAVCAGCGQVFEVVKDGDATCPRCKGGTLDEEERRSCRAFLAGYDDGWRLGIEGASAEVWRATARAWAHPRLDRYVAGLRLARRKAAAYLDAGLPGGRSPGRLF